MPYQIPDSTSQTGTAYKARIDGAAAALAGVAGKRRNINGDGRIDQLVAAVAISASWQYLLDMWEVETADAVHSSGNFGQIVNANFPAGLAIGSSGLTTTGAAAIKFRTKLESLNVADMLSAPFTYPVASPLHPYASLGILAFQDSGVAVNVTPVLRSADVVNNFATMTNSLTGAVQSLPSGAVTQLWWDGAANAFQLDSLTNARNGLCLELDFAMPTGVSAKNLQLGDVQLEPGQVASYYGRNRFDDELRACQRFYAKTFPLATAPAQNGGTAGVLAFHQVVGAAAAQKGNFWPYPQRMIAPPSITSFNPSAANAQPRNPDAAADCSAFATDIIGEWGASFNLTTAAGSASGQRNYVHLIADSRL
jgi:hypothetical protein